jgi:hypothetical protein
MLQIATTKNKNKKKNKWESLLRFESFMGMNVKHFLLLGCDAIQGDVTPAVKPILIAENIASRVRKCAKIFHWISAPFSSNTLIPLFMFLDIPNKVRLDVWNTRVLFEDLTVCIFLLLYEETRSPAKMI